MSSSIFHPVLQGRDPAGLDRWVLTGRIENPAELLRGGWKRLLLLGRKIKGISIFPSSGDSEVREQLRSFRGLPAPQTFQQVYQEAKQEDERKAPV